MIDPDITIFMENGKSFFAKLIHQPLTPAGQGHPTCNKCGHFIDWAITKKGKYVPINWIEEKKRWESHFHHCERIT